MKLNSQLFPALGVRNEEREDVAFPQWPDLGARGWGSPESQPSRTFASFQPHPQSTFDVLPDRRRVRREEKWISVHVGLQTIADRLPGNIYRLHFLCSVANAHAWGTFPESTPGSLLTGSRAWVMNSFLYSKNTYDVPAITSYSARGCVNQDVGFSCSCFFG